MGNIRNHKATAQAKSLGICEKSSKVAIYSYT